MINKLIEENNILKEKVEREGTKTNILRAMEGKADAIRKQNRKQ